MVIVSQKNTEGLIAYQIDDATGGLPAGYISINASRALPASYERSEGAIRLRHWTNFGFLASDYDAKAAASGPPPGWTTYNEGAIGTMTLNEGGTGALAFTANGAGNWYAGTHTAGAMLMAGPDGWDAGDQFIFRSAVEFGGGITNEEGAILGLTNATFLAPTTFPTNQGMFWDHGFINSLQKVGARNDSGRTSITAGITQAVNEAGIWFKLRNQGHLTSWWLDTTDSAVSPDAAGRPWHSAPRNNQAVPLDSGAPLEWGAILGSYNNAAADQTIRVTHLEFRGSDPLNNSSVNCGVDASTPAIQFIADFNIGADATVTEADLRAALAACENLRPYDSAAWTYSAVRSATPGAAPAALLTAATATITGSGALFNLFGACASDGTHSGSFMNSQFRLPVTTA